MVNGFNRPPKLSTPERAPWEEVKELTRRLDRMITLMERNAGIPAIGGPPGAPGVPGAPGGISDLVLLMKELVPESIGNSQVIPFQKTIATAYQDEQDRQVSITGIIRDVIIAFPAGCHQLVEVRLIYFPKGGSKAFIVPTIDDSFIAVDDFTAVFQPRFPVKAPGNLRVEWWNYDSLNTHNVPVIVTLVPTNLEVKT